MDKKLEVVDRVLDQAEDKLTGVSRKEVNPDFEFSVDFENSESEILRKDDLSSEEMIEAIIMKHSLHREERVFLLEYAEQVIKFKHYDDIDEEVSKNLVTIVNHIFEYGFKTQEIEQDEGNAGKDTNDDGIDFLKNIIKQEKSKKAVLHYWDLITKHLQNDNSSVQYINNKMYPSEEGEKVETLEKKQQKALAWLIILFSEHNSMSYVFKNFFANGSIMAYYDSESFMFENREFLLEFAEKFYQGITSEKLFRNSNVH